MGDTDGHNSEHVVHRWAPSGPGQCLGPAAGPPLVHDDRRTDGAAEEENLVCVHGVDLEPVERRRGVKDLENKTKKVASRALLYRYVS